MCRKGLNMWWYIIISLCIGFIVGNFFGFLCACLMAAASREDRRREKEDDIA